MQEVAGPKEMQKFLKRSSITFWRFLQKKFRVTTF